MWWNSLSLSQSFHWLHSSLQLYNQILQFLFLTQNRILNIMPNTSLLYVKLYPLYFHTVWYFMLLNKYKLTKNFSAGEYVVLQLTKFVFDLKQKCFEDKMQFHFLLYAFSWSWFSTPVSLLRIFYIFTTATFLTELLATG